jgi:transcriptional/translational regulatory protein YebC/TACO1
VRTALTRNGGTFADAGSVSYLFKPRGYIALGKDKVSEDRLMEIALDAGADDIQGSSDSWEVYTSPGSYEAVLEAIKKAGLVPDEAQVGKYAENHITLEGAKAQQMLKLMEALEDHDDVQNVWANFDISENEMEAAAAS